MFLLLLAVSAWAQPPDFPFPGPGGPGGFGRGGPGGPGGPRGGFPGMEERKIVKDYDRDGDKQLNAEERAAARAAMSKEQRPGPPRFRRENEEPPQPGPKLKPSEVKRYGKEPLYDSTVLRTLFLEFENADWEKELADFHNTDVEVPAKLTVDGKAYPGIGVHFRGASSYMMIGDGRKRSLNLSIDFTNKDQRLLGYRTLNLLNSNQDPTFLRSVLYLQAAREYLPAPKANHLRVVINGESWGVYVNAEQFNSDFIQEWFRGDKGGARWKVPGRPGSRGGGLSYLGDSPAEYRRNYEIKSKDDPKSWAALIHFTKVLNEIPPEKLEAALTPLLDVDGALKFLALEKVFINNDGYWTRASDYSIYLNPRGKFHIIPHDVNETFAPAEMMGPGMFGPRPGGRGGPNGPPPPWMMNGERPQGPPEGRPHERPQGPPPPMREGDVKLDIYAGSDDPNKALLHRLLAVPALKQRYTGYVKEIAAKWLDWNKLGPLAAKYQDLIAADVAADTRKLDTTENFRKAVTETTTQRGGPGPFGGRPHMSLKEFVEKRRAYLLQ